MVFTAVSRNPCGKGTGAAGAAAVIAGLLLVRLTVGLVTATSLSELQREMAYPTTSTANASVIATRPGVQKELFSASVAATSLVFLDDSSGPAILLISLILIRHFRNSERG